MVGEATGVGVGEMKGVGVGVGICVDIGVTDTAGALVGTTILLIMVMGTLVGTGLGVGVGITCVLTPKTFVWAMWLFAVIFPEKKAKTRKVMIPSTFPFVYKNCFIFFCSKGDFFAYKKSLLDLSSVAFSVGGFPRRIKKVLLGKKV